MCCKGSKLYLIVKRHKHILNFLCFPCLWHVFSLTNNASTMNSSKQISRMDLSCAVAVVVVRLMFYCVMDVALICCIVQARAMVFTYLSTTFFRNTYISLFCKLSCSIYVHSTHKQIYNIYVGVTALRSGHGACHLF